MAGKFILTLGDYTGESSSLTVPGAELDASNFDAQDTLMDALKAAILAVCDDDVVVRRETRMASQTATNKARSTSKQCQREIKWIVTGQDTLNYRPVRFEIPCADLQHIEDDGTIDLTAGVGLALKDACEDYWLALGSSVEVLEVRHVGRNT